MENNGVIKKLLERGVQMPHAGSVYVDPDIAPERIAAGVVVHPGCRILGADTSIGGGSVIGGEAPVTLKSCRLGRNVVLAGGTFEKAVFFDHASMGNCAHVRAGVLLEEEASCAHAVGLKQTVLLPFVVLGSLINFCDCLMAGGTSRKDHSEVGSSYIHFNYTPHQDKATAPLSGDVPRGVMLDQAPVFLGGQGGLVGPSRVVFGAVTPAGTVLRKDILCAGLYVAPSPASKAQARCLSYQQGAYRVIRRIVLNNLVYIGNICALRAWHLHARRIFMEGDPFQSACRHGALECLDAILAERIKRLGELAEKMPRSLALAAAAGQEMEGECYRQQKLFVACWPAMRAALSGLPQFEGAIEKRDRVLSALGADSQRNYTDAVRALSAQARADGTAWLQSIVDSAAALWPQIES